MFLRLKFFEFLLFYALFVSPFAELSPYPCTPSVANDDFCSKSVCPGCRIWANPDKKRQEHCFNTVLLSFLYTKNVGFDKI